MNEPIYLITANGKDLTSSISPRLVSLSITECRADDADELNLTLDDSKGQLALPKRGTMLDVSIGWKETGLVKKGSYKVDEIEYSGAPDEITVRARSASLSKGLGERREQSWNNQTIKAIVQTIAARHQLTPKVGDALGKVMIPHIDQTHESDMSFLTRLAKRYDAVMNVKDGNLIFMPIGQSKTVGGKSLPVLNLTRQDGDRHRYHEAERESYEAVRAYYHVTQKHRRESVLYGGENSTNVKVLPESYPTKEEALAAAEAEYKRIQRAIATFEYTLAIGMPELFPEMPVTVTGYGKPEIDAQPWLVKKATHHIAGHGYETALELEMRDDPASERHRTQFRRTK